MKSPLLNINFCGTGMEATRPGLASVQAIKQFENRLILSGVGAPSGFDETNNEHYPTPGTFYVDEQLKRQPRSYWLNDPMVVLQQGAGIAWGAGERDNFALAMTHVQQKMTGIAAHESVHINVSGYSRGAASALHFANKIYKEYGRRIKINLCLIDPNAGPGLQFNQYKRNIPSTVLNMYVIFNRHERLHTFRSLSPRHYVLTNAQTAFSALYVHGSHLEQEQVPLSDGDTLCSSAGINQRLLELFYASYGAHRLSPAVERPLLSTSSHIKKGFTRVQSEQTAMDVAISQLETLANHVEAPLQFDDNAHLTQFNQEISGLNNQHYNDLSYYFMHLLSEVNRLVLTTAAQRRTSAVLLQVTNELICAMTPSVG